MGWIHPGEAQPEVSVIVPVYNREALLERALTSLAQQDFDLPFEVVVVDDGSTDASASLAERFDPRVQVIRQINLKAHRARETGARAARGRRIAFLDSDDELKPFHLSAHYEALQRVPEAILSYGSSEDQSRTTYRKDLPLPQPESPSGLLREPFRALLECDCFIVGMNIMLQRSTLLDLYEGLEDYSPAEDIGLLFRAAAKGPFACVGRSTHVRHLQSDSVSTVQNTIQVARSLRAMIESWKASKYFYESELRTEIKRIVKEYLPPGLAGLLVAGQWREAREVFSYIQYAGGFSVYRNTVRQWLWQMGWMKLPVILREANLSHSPPGTRRAA